MQRSEFQTRNGIRRLEDITPCLHCQACEIAKEEGRVQGFYLSAGITLAAVAVMGWLIPWLLGP